MAGHVEQILEIANLGAEPTVEAIQHELEAKCAQNGRNKKQVKAIGAITNLLCDMSGAILPDSRIGWDGEIAAAAVKMGPGAAEAPPLQAAKA